MTTTGTSAAQHAERLGAPWRYGVDTQPSMLQLSSLPMHNNITMLQKAASCLQQLSLLPAAGILLYLLDQRPLRAIVCIDTFMSVDDAT